MRFLVLALLVLGFVGVTPANAKYARHHHGKHASQLTIYGWERGVIVRAYWLAPWRNRHYYPTTGEKPEIGRLEDLSAVRERPEPAEDFQRSWSTSSAFANEEPGGHPRFMPAQDPRAEELPQLPQLPQSQAPAVRP